MKHTCGALAALLTGALVLCGAVLAQDQSKPVVTRINFIANEGLLLLTGAEDGVLIDALFRDSVEPYDKIPAATADHMETAQKPFDQVKLVLVTHKHPDHFNAKSVVRFLENNVEAKLVAPQQVIDEVKGASSKYESIAERVSALSPKGSESATAEFGEVKVEALSLSHGSGEMEKVANYGYIVEIGGKRLLHVGDAQVNDETKRVLAQHAVGVDSACVPYWWLLEKDGREFLDHTLKPQSIVAIHVPPAQADDIEHQIRVQMPEVVVFTKSWTSKRL